MFSEAPITTTKKLIEKTGFQGHASLIIFCPNKTITVSFTLWEVLFVN